MIEFTSSMTVALPELIVVDVNQLTKPIPLGPRRRVLMRVLLIVLGSLLLFMSIAIAVLVATIALGGGPPGKKASDSGAMILASLLFGTLGVAMIRGARRLRSGKEFGLVVSPWAIQLVGGLMTIVPLLQFAGVGARPGVGFAYGALVTGIGMVWAGHRLRNAASQETESHHDRGLPDG